MQLDCYYLGRNLKDHQQKKVFDLFNNHEILSIKLKSLTKNLPIDNTSLNPNNKNIKDNNIRTTPNSSPIYRKILFFIFF